MKKKKLELGIDFFEAIEKKIPIGQGNSGRIYVPKSWEGKKVIVLKVEK